MGPVLNSSSNKCKEKSQVFRESEWNLIAGLVLFMRRRQRHKTETDKKRKVSTVGRKEKKKYLIGLCKINSKSSWLKIHNTQLQTESMWFNSDNNDTPCLGIQVILTISLGYRNSTGCTGTPGMNAPAGKEGQKVNKWESERTCALTLFHSKGWVWHLNYSLSHLKHDPSVWLWVWS